jgi:hypothetical protein
MKLVNKIINYKKFGKCLFITNGYFDLMVTVDVGPRIIFFGLHNDKNILFEDNDSVFIMKQTEFTKIFGRDSV